MYTHESIAGNSRGDFEAPRDDYSLCQTVSMNDAVGAHGLEVTPMRAEGSPELFRLLIDQSNDGIEVIDPETGRLLDVNQTTCERLGYSREELLSMRVMDISTTMVTEELWQEGLEEIRLTGFRIAESRHRRKDGSTVPVEVNVRYIRLNRDYMLAVVRDITERKRAEKELRQRTEELDRLNETLRREIAERNEAEKRIAQLNRLKAILGGVNHAIIHIPEQEKLLAEICRLAVEEGLFKLAWIGSVSPDGSVDVVAKAGLTAYLDGIFISAREEPAGNGAVGTAIRENRVSVIEDMFHDARTAPWRDRARQFGLQYIAAFPLHIAGKVWGSFQAYAPHSNFFDNNEINLLIQVCQEISMALTAIHHRANRESDEARLRLQIGALEAAANAIVITDNKGVIEWANTAFATLTGYSVAEVIGNTPRVLKSGKHGKAFYKNLWETVTAGKVWHEELVNRRKDGTLYNEEMTITPMTDDHGGITHFIAVKQDITTRKVLEAEFVDISRQAGMAEVATGVLHNVGNVLNSVNISANVLQDHVRSAPVADLDRVIALLREQGAGLGEFFTNDQRGPKVMDFLSKLAGLLSDLQAAQVKEVTALQKNVDHIKDIVSMHQSYACVSGLTETLKVTELVEDALRMNVDTFQHHCVRLVREFQPGVPAITTEKHKVLQILVNLMSNARSACDASSRTDKQVTVRVTNSDGRVRIQVIDNGIGIPAENLNRIFTHGFTTKKNGHGFGLHNSANTAKEIGGSLAVHSDGSGHGATFTLELPVQRGTDVLSI